MSGIFDEANMRQTLGRYIPGGETLLAGIHAVSQETVIRGVFEKCICTEDRLIPDEHGGAVALSKEKHETYDIYIGITQNFLVLTGCEREAYYYQFEDAPDMRSAGVREVTSELLLADIGMCFPLTDIRSCEMKKGWVGSVKCKLAMKSGSSFKLMFPKLGGLGGGMPHHAEYREAIIARLCACGA